MKLGKHCLSFTIVLWTSVALSFQQSPAIRFVDQSGKMLAQVETVTRDAVLYVPVDALSRIIDSGMRRKYDLTGRLTLVLNRKRIELHLGTHSATVAGQAGPITLSHPPLVINQRPMLPITFFTELLPKIFNLDVAYNAELHRVRIVESQNALPIPKSNEGFLVVVDPGHGGMDTGCQGSDGVLEKEITLAVAKHVETYCRQNGIRVVLTRDGDHERRPVERVQIANQSGGQLFLSLHCNASYAAAAKGVHLFVNNSIWQRQSSDSASSSTDSVSNRTEIITLTQEDFLAQSQEFASILQEQLKTPTVDLIPLTEIPLTTLSEVYMPALLIELGYLSNAANQEKLTDFGRQETIAGSIGSAIAEYKATLEAAQNFSNGE